MVGVPGYYAGQGGRILHSRDYLTDNRLYYAPADEHLSYQNPGDDNYHSGGWYKKDGYLLTSYNYNPQLFLKLDDLTTYKAGGGGFGPLVPSTSRQPCTDNDYSPAEALLAMDRVSQPAGNGRPICHSTSGIYHLLHLDGHVSTVRDNNYGEWLPNDTWTTFDNIIDGWVR